MKNISTITSLTGKSIAVLCFLFFTGCLDNDEGLFPSDDSAFKEHALSEAGSSSMNQTGRVFTAHLRGRNEVPAVQTGATGQAVFKLSDDGLSLSYKLTVANIEKATQAHIHCGAEGVNGPVVVFLFGFNAQGVNANGVLAEGTITASNVIVRPDSQECMGGIADFSGLLQKIISGEAYVNVHTVANPPGEIRGQIR